MENINEEAKEKIQKAKYAQYQRRNKISLSQAKTSVKNPLHLKTDSFPPKTLEVKLSIHPVTTLSNLNVPVPFISLLKIPEQYKKVKDFLFNLKEIQNEVEDPAIFLQTARPQVDGNPLFFVTMEMGDLLLHNCMVDSGAASNITRLTMMEQLGLQITHP